MGAGLADHVSAGDGLGQGRVDVPYLPGHLPGPAAAAVPAHCPAAVPTEHQVLLRDMRPSWCTGFAGVLCFSVNTSTGFWCANASHWGPASATAARKGSPSDPLPLLPAIFGSELACPAAEVKTDAEPHCSAVCTCCDYDTCFSLLHIN